MTRIMKCVASLVVSLIVGYASMAAGTLSPMFNEFKSESNCRVVSIPRVAMWAASIGSPDPLMSKIHSMKVMNFEQCDSSQADRISRRASQLAVGNEPLVRVNDDGERVTVWMDADGDKISSIYVFVNQHGRELTLVEFNGSFTADDIEQLIVRAQDEKE